MSDKDLRTEYDTEEDYDDLSQEQYFNRGLAEDGEERRPAPQKQKSGGKKKRRKVNRLKMLLIIVGALLVLSLILWLVISISRKRNNGALYAQKLAESIGLSVVNAQQAADITLKADSAYPTLNTIYVMNNTKAESKRSVVVSGVHLPQWLILCEKDGDVLSSVKFYDYRALKDNVFGEKRRGYIDPNSVVTGTSVEQVEEQLGLVPYCTQYLPDKTVQRDYRYCFKDPESGDLWSYTISTVWSPEGTLLGTTDLRGDYMAGLLN